MLDKLHEVKNYQFTFSPFFLVNLFVNLVVFDNKTVAADNLTCKSKMEEMDDTRNCPVCLEAFDIENTLPRILPCSHSACERCLGELLKNRKTLVCPQCRKKHAAKSGLISFPENKYISRNLKTNAKLQGGDQFNMCPDHERQLSLYCKGEKCLRDICQLCLLNSHKDHDVVDIIQEGKDRVECLKRFAEKCKVGLLDAKEIVNKSCKESVMKLIE